MVALFVKIIYLYFAVQTLQVQNKCIGGQIVPYGMLQSDK
jgi:hypothetical protein